MVFLWYDDIGPGLSAIIRHNHERIGGMELKGRLFNIQKFSINDGPGIRTTVFFKGCPLACAWCANPESQNRYAAIAGRMADEAFSGKEYTAAEVMDEVRKDKPFYDKSGGGMTLSGGEVLQQAEFAAALLTAARAEGIHTALETTGFAPAERFLELAEQADLLLYDFKHYDSRIHQEGTGVPNDIILSNLGLAVSRGLAVIARIPVIPGFNSALADARGMADALRDRGVSTVHLLPFHQMGESKYQRMKVPYRMAGCAQLHADMLADYQDVFLKQGFDCSFQ